MRVVADRTQGIAGQQDGSQISPVQLELSLGRGLSLEGGMEEIEKVGELCGHVGNVLERGSVKLGSGGKLNGVMDKCSVDASEGEMKKLMLGVEVLNGLVPELGYVAEAEKFELMAPGEVMKVKGKGWKGSAKLERLFEGSSEHMHMLVHPRVLLDGRRSPELIELEREGEEGVSEELLEEVGPILVVLSVSEGKVELGAYRRKRKEYVRNEDSLDIVCKEALKALMEQLMRCGYGPKPSDQWRVGEVEQVKTECQGSDGLVAQWFAQLFSIAGGAEVHVQPTKGRAAVSAKAHSVARAMLECALTLRNKLPEPSAVVATPNDQLQDPEERPGPSRRPKKAKKPKQVPADSSGDESDGGAGCGRPWTRAAAAIAAKGRQGVAAVKRKLKRNRTVAAEDVPEVAAEGVVTKKKKTGQEVPTVRGRGRESGESGLSESPVAGPSTQGVEQLQEQSFDSLQHDDPLPAVSPVHSESEEEAPGGEEEEREARRNLRKRKSLPQPDEHELKLAKLAWFDEEAAARRVVLENGEDYVQNPAPGPGSSPAKLRGYYEAYQIMFAVVNEKGALVKKTVEGRGRFQCQWCEEYLPDGKGNSPAGMMNHTKRCAAYHEAKQNERGQAGSLRRSPRVSLAAAKRRGK